MRSLDRPPRRRSAEHIGIEREQDEDPYPFRVRGIDTRPGLRAAGSRAGSSAMIERRPDPTLPRSRAGSHSTSGRPGSLDRRRAPVPAARARRRPGARPAPPPSTPPSARRRAHPRPRNPPSRPTAIPGGAPQDRRRPRSPGIPFERGWCPNARWVASSPEIRRPAWGLVALVHVHDHRGHAPRVRGRLRSAAQQSTRAPGDEPRIARSSASAFAAASSPQTSSSSSGRRGRPGSRPRASAIRRRRARRARPRSASRSTSPPSSAYTPPGPKVGTACADGEASVDPVHRRRSRAVVDRSVRLDREDDEVDAVAVVVVVGPPPTPAVAAASRARSASREPITTSTPASTQAFCHRPAEAAGTADDGDSHAAFLAFSSVQRSTGTRSPASALTPVLIVSWGNQLAPQTP